MNSEGDQKPRAVTPYVQAHGSIVTDTGLDGPIHTPWHATPASGSQVVTNQVDEPFDVEKIREHMEGDHE